MTVKRAGRKPIKHEIKKWLNEDRLVGLCMETLIRIQIAKDVPDLQKGKFAVPIVTQHLKEKQMENQSKQVGDFVLQLVNYNTLPSDQKDTIIDIDPIEVPEIRIIDGKSTA